MFRIDDEIVEDVSHTIRMGWMSTRHLAFSITRCHRNLRVSFIEGRLEF
jgi:hypothetical protein